MNSTTQKFIDELVVAQKNKILSIEILGSCEGENDLTISDIDFLIICKRKKDITSVFNTALEIQEKIFKINSSTIDKFVQRSFLASNNYGGIHLIVIGRDELDDYFRPISLRLRLMTKLIGRNLFLYEIQQCHQFVYGKNFADEIKIEQPKFSEKLACFIFPSLVLALSLPTFLFHRRTFKIWCFKAIKYHTMSLQGFVTITKQNYVLDNTMLKIAKVFRYKPDDYQENSMILYLRAWKNILRNVPFLFSKMQSLKSEL